VIGSRGHTTVGDLGKAHKIHTMVNNRYAEHHSTMFEMSSTMFDQNFSILIDLGATKSFISSVVLKIIKVNAVEQDAFTYLEMASSAKNKVGGRVTDFNIDLRYLVAKAHLPIMILGSYEIVITMD
jgi:hypothetical protein